jgi:hypothetical protein
MLEYALFTIDGLESVQPNLAGARSEAIHQIRIILDADVSAGRPQRMGRTIFITGAAGDLLLEVPFRDALI